MSVAAILRFTASGLVLLVLTACGGAGGGKGPQATGPLPLALPPGHGLSAGDISVAAGQSMEHGNVVISCPAGGPACDINVAADGTASYARAGGMPTLGILPLMAGSGQSRSDAAPVFATDETSILNATLSAPDKVFPALSTTVVRHSGTLGTELSTDFFVKSIHRNASGEYVVEYVLNGTEEEITLDTGDCRSSSCRFTLDGRQFYFWAWTDDDFDDLTHDGLRAYDYLASLELSHRTADGMQEPRTWFVFGVRTEDLPMGDATYQASFRARSYSTENSSNRQRQDHFGNVRLVANFDMRELNGRIYRVRGRPLGGGNWRTWRTSSFAITNGRIVNGQFTATLTGVDDAPTTPYDESVRDFVGSILGEFYGPNAEEVGGVVTAIRDVAGTANDRLLYGYIGGRETDPLTGVNDSAAFLTGVDRDHMADSTTLTAVERPTVESTDDGFRITYVVDGQTHTVALGEDDFGANPIRAYWYSRETDGTEFRLTSATGAFTTSSRRFVSGFRPEHFEVFLWGIYHTDVANDPTSSSFGRMVYGNRTVDMPATGTARYAGRVGVQEWPSDAAIFSSNPRYRSYRGDVSLTADFGGSTVVGSATILGTRPGGADDWVSASGGLSFNAAVQGSGLSATDLSGSGALAGYSGGRVDGAFYGPGAAEVAGVFDATHGTDNKLLSGYFGGQKQ